MFRQAKAMPKEQAIGPKQQGPSWSVARALAERASEASTGDDIYLARELMDVAWKNFASTAEEQLAITTDMQNLRKGLRACHPQAQWVKVFKARGPLRTLRPSMMDGAGPWQQQGRR